MSSIQLTFLALLGLSFLGLGLATDPGCHATGTYMSFGILSETFEDNANQCLRVCKEADGAVAFTFRHEDGECLCATHAEDYRWGKHIQGVFLRMQKSKPL